MIAKRKRRRRAARKSFIADGVTPIAAYLALTRVRPGPAFLFESAPSPEATSRYSVIGLGVRGELRAADGACRLFVDGSRVTEPGRDPLWAARTLMRELRPADEALVDMPFLGAYGAAAFEFAGYLERLPPVPRGDDPMPDLHLVVPETLVVFDHFTHRVSVGTLADGDGEIRADGDVLEALERAQVALLDSQLAGSALAEEVLRSPLPFERAAARAKEAIAAGDAYQVVLSRRWIVYARVKPFDAYRMLRAINPSPYMFYLDLGWGQLFGSSPEMLARLDRRRARVRPLAGTRPRSANLDADRRLAAELRRDPKERAEHVMLVDLGRNDVGRVSRFGSVRTTRLFEVERYSHVMHLMSEVVGSLRSECDAFDLFAAAFPAGTVSGAPKIRAMELIAELEGARRGFYAGSVAHFGFAGSMEACITLRSAHAYNGRFIAQAGAGIVADSEPAAESRECAAKARAVMEALGAG